MNPLWGRGDRVGKIIDAFGDLVLVRINQKSFSFMGREFLSDWEHAFLSSLAQQWLDGKHPSKWSSKQVAQVYSIRDRVIGRAKRKRETA